MTLPAILFWGWLLVTLGFFVGYITGAIFATREPQNHLGGDQ